jgi:hypothetical protein
VLPIPTVRLDAENRVFLFAYCEKDRIDGDKSIGFILLEKIQTVFLYAG